MRGEERRQQIPQRFSSPGDAPPPARRRWSGHAKPKSAAQEKSCSHQWTVTARGPALTVSLPRQSLGLFRFPSSLLAVPATRSTLLKSFPLDGPTPPSPLLYSISARTPLLN